MGLEKIEQAALGSAHTQAEHIAQAARKAADEKLAAFRDAETQLCERRYQAETRAIEEELGRVLIQQKGAANKKLLEKRNARLASVFARARARILEAPLDEYVAIMRKRLERSAGPGAAHVRVHPDDERTFFALLAEFNKRRPESEALTLAPARPLAQRGGFILVSARYEVDQTLDALMSDVERDLAPEIAAKLFGDQA